MYPDAEAFPIRDHAPRRPSDEVSSESSEASIVAPARRVRNRRALPLDETMELPNSDLVDWNNNYVRHMQEAVRIKHNNRSATVARVNANFWVLQSGVGGIGRLLGPERIPEPLQMFAGDKLLEALTGLRLGAAGEKHPREEEETGEGDGEERRVRSRTGESEVGRGDVDMPGLDDDELPQVYGDDVSPHLAQQKHDYILIARADRRDWPRRRHSPRRPQFDSDALEHQRLNPRLLRPSTNPTLLRRRHRLSKQLHRRRSRSFPGPPCQLHRT